MPKFMTAPAGTNPMEMPELIKRKRASRLKLIGLVLAGLLVLTCMCGVPAYFMTRPKEVAAAPAHTPTAEVTPTVTQTLPSAPTATGTATAEVIPPMDLTRRSGTPTAAPWPVSTQTPWVVTKVVNQPGTTTIIEKHIEKTVVVPVQQTVIVEITSTPGPTQTPWVEIISRPVEVTRIVEVTVVVTPTETPSPTPTETAEPETPIHVP